MFPLLDSPLFSIEKDGNFSVPKLRIAVSCSLDTRGTMAAPECFLVTNFHSEVSGDAEVCGPGVTIPEGVAEFSNVTVVSTRSGSDSPAFSAGSMFAWNSLDVFSS